MGFLGISLIVASAVLFLLRPPAWLPGFFRDFGRPRLGPPPEVPLIDLDNADDDASAAQLTREAEAKGKSKSAQSNDHTAKAPNRTQTAKLDRASMPPPALREPAQIVPKIMDVGEEDEEQSTPKASATPRADAVPALSLSVSEASPSGPSNMPRSIPAPPKPTPTPGLMAPPPRPPSLNPLSSSSLSPLPNRNLPIPNRGPAGGSSLAPPPTHSTKPKKPSRQVVLTPGHSPLDWARLSSSPTADLRGVPRDTPYLRVTPSMLKKQTGRRGKDAWTVLGGRVYNMTPYLPFHPGGEPELLRGAARDGTKLFGEVHPWVNYEGMLAACLVGIYVTEEDGAGAAGTAGGGKMEEMD